MTKKWLLWVTKLVKTQIIKVEALNFNFHYISGQIGNLPHSQLVYGYATTSAQKTKQFFDQTLTCLCYYTISSPMLTKKNKKFVVIIKNQKNRTNSVKSLPEKIMKKKNHYSWRSMIFFFEKNHSLKTHLFSSHNQKKTLKNQSNPTLFCDRELSIAQGLSFCYALSKITWKKHKDFDNYLFDKKNM